VNDITNVYDGLVKYFGFASTDIAMLSDKRATKKAILEGLKGLKKGVTLEVILDSCHSGTGTREMILDRTSLRNLPPALMDEHAPWASSYCIRPRFLAPPPDIALRADEIFGKTLKMHRIGEDSAPNYVLWAACRSDRYSADADVGGTLGGAFTYFCCKHIRDTAGKVNRSEMLKLVRASRKHEGFSQVPQLEGPENSKKRGIFV